MNDKISVIITTYNDENEIRALLKDILSQDLTPYEIIVADGGSKDATLSILQKAKEQSSVPIKLLSGKRLNISQGLNAALKVATGDLIAIMMTGNKYETTYLKKLAISLHATDADVVYPIVVGEQYNKFQAIYSRALINSAPEANFPNNHGGLVRMEVFRKIGLFYENFIYAGEDAEFFERAKSQKLKMVCEPTVNVIWSVPNNFKRFLKERKYYAIAEMQINSFSILIHKYYKRILILLVLLCLLLFYRRPFIYAGFACLYFMYVLWGSRNIGLSAFGLKRFILWYYLFVIVSNPKYLQKKYHVDPTKIPLL